MKRTRTVKIYPLFIIVVVFLFALIILKLCYVVLSPNVDGKNLSEFASNRNTVKEKIVAERGTIYDSLGNELALNVNSYTVIAYLEESRTTDINNPQHVVDKEKTAEVLSPIINMTKENILNLLNTENVYQVELGPGGRGITELVKETIEKLELPGIDFIKSVKRYYPNRDFLSYTLGYAKTNDDGTIKGEMGLELEFNDELTGVDGERVYEGDVYGYKIANTNETVTKAKNGNDVYLTIDTNIQMFTEQALSTIEEASYLEWATISVVNAKTGEILGVASNPSFDPNIKNIVNYYDPFVSYTYEPGSTMKIFSFMSAMENGVYDGNETYKSGTLTIDEFTIKDWNTYGWGEITFDQGFYGSSNVAASLLAKKLGGSSLKDFYKKLGYGKKTGINLPNESKGVVNFKYEVEVANASFGQGMSATPVQMVQALTSLANDGTVIRPYIVKKVVDSETGKILLENKRKELNKVASKETVDKIKDLMYGVVNSEESMATGGGYRTSVVTTIGKTGTAQIASKNGGYLTGYNDYVKSFAGLFPYEDPEIIIYVAVSKSTNSNLTSKAIKTLIEDVSTYLGIVSEEKNTQNYYEIPSFINKNKDSVLDNLKDKNIDVIVVGEGDKIIKQYPSKNSIVNVNDKIFLITNDTKPKYANIENWSRNDLEIYAKLLGVTFTFNGYGYAYNTNLTNQEIVKGQTTEINLKTKYEDDNSTKNTE